MRSYTPSQYMARRRRCKEPLASRAGGACRGETAISTRWLNVDTPVKAAAAEQALCGSISIKVTPTRQL